MIEKKYLKKYYWNVKKKETFSVVFFGRNYLLSKVIKILFKVFKTHLVFVYLCIFETVLNLIQGDFLSKSLKHSNHVIGRKVPFSYSNKNLLFLIEMVEQKQQVILHIR